jgi:2'-5' RNA ligase
MRRELPDARWVRPESLHLTLKFLGQAPTRVVDDLCVDLEAALAGCASSEVELGGSGLFPSLARPRVGWIGGRADGVVGIAERVERIAVARGFPPERRDWAPHLTVARLRKPWSRSAVDQFLAWGDALRVEVFSCREVVLFASDLAPSGAVYTAVERFPLG